MQNFNPNDAVTEDAGLFGLPFTEAESALVLLPVPWEATTSYGGGTSKGPEAILKASHQVDLFDLEINRPYEAGIALLPVSEEIKKWNAKARAHAEPVIEAAGVVNDNPALQRSLETVNQLSAKLNTHVKEETKRLLSQNKIVGIIGGDHSTPFGAIEAVAEKYPSFGILQFDAHSDTREAFEGFTFSHASIFYNILERIPAVKKLVQVGIRDFCDAEYDYIQSQGNRMSVFFDSHMARKKMNGAMWHSLATEIVTSLPDKVWISVDIDGLDPRFCPNTGTPVPGGLDFHELTHIIKLLALSGKEIIGFDLCEVSPDANGTNEWDANVGARLLYKLCGWTLLNRGKVRLLNQL